MTREDQVLALMADANPVSDPSTFVIDPETRARLETIEHWSETMGESKLRSIDPSVSRKNRRNWLVGAGAAAVLVLIVGLGSWAVIGGDSGADVAGSGEPTVTFDGATCTYSGPGEFVVGSVNEFTLQNNTDTKTGFLIAQIEDGLTMDDVNRIGFEDLALPGKTYTRDAEPGGEAVANPVFDEPSAWLVMCFVRVPDATDSAPAGDHPSAVFQVVGS